MTENEFYILIAAMIVAILISLYEMYDSLSIKYRPGCSECDKHRQIRENAEKRRQEQESSHRLTRPGADEESGKSDGGGWMV